MPNKDSLGYIRETRNGRRDRKHRFIAERILGRRLRDKECVHHYGTKVENDKLIICQDNAYHMLLHKRTRAYLACGDGNAQSCKYCGKYEPIVILDRNGKNPHHIICARIYDAKRRPKEREARRVREQKRREVSRAAMALLR